MGLTRLAVLVSGSGTNLQALIDSAERGENPAGRIALVASSAPDAYGLERARAARLPVLALDKKALGSQGFEARLLQALLEQEIDLLVLAGFLHILSRDFIARLQVPIINIHPALLPAFGGRGFYGLKVHQAVLAAGVPFTGATVHYVNEIPDGGQILLQKQVPVLPGDTPELLQQRVMEQAEWLLLPQAVARLCTELQRQKEASLDAPS